MERPPSHPTAGPPHPLPARAPAILGGARHHGPQRSPICHRTRPHAQTRGNPTLPPVRGTGWGWGPSRAGDQAGLSGAPRRDFSSWVTEGSLPGSAQVYRVLRPRGTGGASVHRLSCSVGALTDPVTFDQEVSNPDLAVTVPRKDPYLQGAPDHFGKRCPAHPLGAVKQ